MLCLHGHTNAHKQTLVRVTDRIIKDVDRLDMLMEIALFSSDAVTSLPAAETIFWIFPDLSCYFLQD